MIHHILDFTHSPAKFAKLQTQETFDAVGVLKVGGIFVHKSEIGDR